MDTPQAKPTEPEVKLPPLLNLTREQRELILAFHQVECRGILALNFRNTEDDSLNIRAKVYHDGGKDMCVYLLEFDEKQMEKFEQEKQTAMSSTPLERRQEAASSGSDGGDQTF